MSEFADERDELCRRFRESLSKPLSERFYDEDQLVDLFDYAGDLNDDYLRMEVLLSGARLYPDSEPLRLRRAIFFGGFEGDAQAKFLQDNNGYGAMWDILRVRYSDSKGDWLRAELDELLINYSKFDDEELIQLVNVATYLGMFKWLVDNQSLLEERTDYPMTIYFEMAVSAEELGEFDKAVELLERLTDEDPSNAEHWFMLAQDYQRLERHEQSLNAIEFALALQPKNTQMRAFRASVFLRLQRSLPLALKELEDIRREFPDDPELIELYVNANDQLNGEADTLAKLRDMAMAERPTYGALTLYLLRDGEDPTLTAALMDNFYDVNQPERTNTRTNWMAWSKFFLDTGYRSLAYMALNRYSAKSGDTLDDEPEYLYLASLEHHDDVALDQIRRMQARGRETFYRSSVKLTITYLVQMLRHGDFEAVDRLYDSIDPGDYGTPDDMNIDELAGRKFMLLLLAEVRARLNQDGGREKQLWADFDPLS